jgi:hypothetical protein
LDKDEETEAGAEELFRVMKEATEGQNGDRVVEVYTLVPPWFEVVPIRSKFPSYSSETKELLKSFTGQKATTKDNDHLGKWKINTIEGVCTELKSMDSDYRRKQSLLESENEFFFKSNEKVASYFYRCWKADKYVFSTMANANTSSSNNTSGNTDRQHSMEAVENMLKEVLRCKEKTGGNDNTEQEENEETSDNGNEIELSRQDPVVSFDLDGEILPILRSTVLRVIPRSQLAVRVSGRWTSDEKDEEENLVISTSCCGIDAFKDILASLQLHSSEKKNSDNTLEIFVSNYISDSLMQETLDYLLIEPVSIKKI